MTYDAIIIGGGPAGATAGILLASAGWKVAIVEKAIFPRRKVCGEFISAGTWALLDETGVGHELRAIAGPEIRRIGVYARNAAICAPMPRFADAEAGTSRCGVSWSQSKSTSRTSQRDVLTWGRAMGREHLDTILLAKAAEAGAEVFQPCAVTAIEMNRGSFLCRFRAGEEAIASPNLIAAHGSWEPSHLPTFPQRTSPRADDLLGFKAHFRNTKLPEDLMPLLAFPGGYGGMVHTDDNRVSLSCCIQRRCLERIRREHPGKSAGEAVLAYITRNCTAGADALEGAMLDGAWLSAGRIRPGIRVHRRFEAGTSRCDVQSGRITQEVDVAARRPYLKRRETNLYLIGNAAGEAHPVIAEGISMAIQSAWLLCQRLIESAASELRASVLECASPLALSSSMASCASKIVESARGLAHSKTLARQTNALYVSDWLRNFSLRIRVSALIAHLAMSPSAALVLLALFRACPSLLTLGANFCGKVQRANGATKKASVAGRLLGK